MYLFYLAKPTYGGWVSFTAHLQLKYGYPIHKITKTTEKKTRDYGYGTKYQNVNINYLLTIPKEKILITALDKYYLDAIDEFAGCSIVIHDPTELKLNIDLSKFNVITIRPIVSKLLESKGIPNTLKLHPFASVKKQLVKDNPSGAVSISRIDFDKNIDTLCLANKELDNKIEIYGKQNEMYVYHKLNKLDFKEYYCGRFPKCYKALEDILHNKCFVVDNSSIKGDGGGTQYTFLEAIHYDCVLILNKKWITTEDCIWEDKNNCLVIDGVADLLECLSVGSEVQYEKILGESKKILERHIIETDWLDENIQNEWGEWRSNLIYTYE